MKKLIYIFAMAALAFVGCSKNDVVEDNTEDIVSEPFTLIAYTDDVDSKATIDGSLNIKWATDDRIVVGMYETGDYTPWEREFRLTEGAGKSNGTFELVGDGTPGENTLYNAIYPKFDNTFYDSGTSKINPAIARIQLKESYTWSENTIFAPMIAYGTAGDKKGLHFKHIGGAVKVTMKNLPVGTTKVSLTLTSDGDLTGNFNYTVADIANVTPGALTSAASNAGKTVSFTFDALGSTTNRTFYFPTPTLTAPEFTISVYVGEDEVWHNSTKAAQSDITRGGLLVMPDATIKPHFLYVMDEGVTASWPSGRQIYISKNIDLYDTEEVDGHTYNKFLIPLSDIGKAVTIYYKEGASGNYQVPISTTLSSSTKKHYFRTDGCNYVAVTNTASPETVQKGIWAIHGDDDSDTYDLWIYTTGDISTAWTAMTKKSENKYNGKPWYFLTYGSSTTGTINVCISFNSKDTGMINGLSISSSHYFGILTPEAYPNGRGYNVIL